MITIATSILVGIQIVAVIVQLFFAHKTRVYYNEALACVRETEQWATVFKANYMKELQRANESMDSEKPTAEQGVSN